MVTPMQRSAQRNTPSSGSVAVPEGLDAPAIAEALDCSVRYVRKLISTGALQSYKWLGRRLVKPEALQAYVNQQTAADKGSGGGAGTGSGGGSSSGAGTGTGNGGAGTGPGREAA